MVNRNGLLAKVIPCTQRTVYIRRLMIQIRRVFDHLHYAGRGYFYGTSTTKKAPEFSTDGMH